MTNWAGEVPFDSGQAELLRAARAELDAVITEVRAVPGFSSFLAAPTFADIAAVAATPLVYLAAAEFGGVAVVVHGDRATTVDAPGLTRDALAERSRSYLDRYTEFRRVPSAGRPAWNAELNDLTRWLWDEIMGPTLDQLGGAREVTLIPGGLLGLFPLHAAWHPVDDGREYVLDRVQVSYAPNARALHVAQRLARDIAGRRVLAVVAPDTGWGSLPLSAAEAAAAVSAFPGSSPVCSPSSVTELIDAMQQADVIHFCGHGFADLQRPLDSGLVLGPGAILRLEQVIGLDLRLRLAVLSACETLLPGTELPDEVIALPTGLLQAGVAGVIASMWLVPDTAAALTTMEFYRRWRSGILSPAAALCEAQRWVRDASRSDLLAAYESSEWLPPSVTEAVLDVLALTPATPADDLVSWAAFAHLGA